MAHVIVEYTDNISSDAYIRPLLVKLAAKMRSEHDVFPIGGVRVRATRLAEYVVADGEEDYAFVNITAKIGRGRSQEFRQRFFGEMFEIVKQHFLPLYETNYLALSLYVEEVGDPAFRYNNLHAKFPKSAK